jgi:hypothetical protein|tara:strand:- start:194 stop:1021 length:828 start_codon:yes stop_codon:yes gene_type:complete
VISAHNGEEIAVATVKKNPTAKEVWDTLSGINVNEHTEDKGGLTYLSWAWAWSIMMDHYPQLVVKWHGMTDEGGVTRDITTYPGGTASVCCSVTIGDDVKREMWLPVMDYKNKAIANPDSRAISDSKQRCLTKCFGILGLGGYVYAGEDLPRGAAPVEVAPFKLDRKKPKPKATNDRFKAAPKHEVTKKSPKKDAGDAITYEEASIDEAITNLKKTVTDLHNRGWTPADNAAKKQITDAIKSRDGEALVRLKKEILALAESALKLHDAKEEKHDV